MENKKLVITRQYPIEAYINFPTEHIELAWKGLREEVALQLYEYFKSAGSPLSRVYINEIIKSRGMYTEFKIEVCVDHSEEK